MIRRVGLYRVNGGTSCEVHLEEGAFDSVVLAKGGTPKAAFAAARKNLARVAALIADAEKRENERCAKHGPARPLRVSGGVS